MRDAREGRVSWRLHRDMEGATELEFPILGRNLLSPINLQLDTVVDLDAVPRGTGCSSRTAIHSAFVRSITPSSEAWTP